ncbi:MAG: AbrB/MazE/SpoVT family DNA-binding domain-containing protein [Nitrolancea sp.]
MPKVTSRGQVMLPKSIRDELGLVPGSEVEFEFKDGTVLLRKKISEEKFAHWKGYLRGKLPNSSVDKLVDELRGERPAGAS